MTAWPDLPYAAWKDSCVTLQLWTQIVGKIRLAQTPWVNHSWHVPLYVTVTGLTTSPVPYGDRAFQVDFDFVDHVLWLKANDGHSRQIVLRPMPVAEFHGLVFEELNQLGIAVTIDNMPNEIADAIPFPEDNVHHAYDRDAAHRFWRILLSSHYVLSHFRSGFLGKVSPVALGEFVLPYEAVRRGDPEGMLMDFLQSTYAAAADHANWDRRALDCEIGAPRRPRAA